MPMTCAPRARYLRISARLSAATGNCTVLAKRVPKKERQQQRSHSTSSRSVGWGRCDAAPAGSGNEDRLASHDALAGLHADFQARQVGHDQVHLGADADLAAQPSLHAGMAEQLADVDVRIVQQQVGVLATVPQGLDDVVLNARERVIAVNERQVDRRQAERRVRTC